MSFREHFWTLIHSYNPNRYEHLLERSWRYYLSFFFFIITCTIILFTILIIPVTYFYLKAIPLATAEIEELQLDAKVKANHQITLLQRPEFVLDMDANMTRTGTLTLTKEGVLYPKYLFYGTTLIKWSEIKDLKQESSTRNTIFSGMIIFLLPSIIFWFFVYSLFKIFLLSTVLAILAYFIMKILHHTLSLQHLVKIIVLSSPSIFLMGIAIYPLAPLFWWGFLLTGVLFALGIALNAEFAQQEHHKKG